MRGKKVLVLDPQLSGPLALIAQTSFLKVLPFHSLHLCGLHKFYLSYHIFLVLSTVNVLHHFLFSLQEHGVENLYYVSADSVPSECKNVIYLVRPRMPLMRQIATHIQQDNRQQLQKSYSVFFMPRRTINCEKVQFVKSLKPYYASYI